ncbi:UDP-glycosyltransferase UGT5-like isoform X2 [Euwallacea similis]|uniref:UDP-glycosyltransferase UGT5-like isoform X2 n=1 Tax=Euwallacea similis TaxID=1736056 RepID=UPI00344EC3DC
MGPRSSHAILALLWVLTHIQPRQCLNVLAIVGHPGKSHFDAFAALFNELADQGHNLTILSHVKPRNSRNIRSVLLRESQPMLHAIDLTTVGDRGVSFPYKQLKLLRQFASDNCPVDLQRPQLRAFLEENNHYDVILGEMFNTLCYNGMIRKFEAPFIGLSSCSFLAWHYDWYGIPYNPAYIQNLLGGFRAPMSFLDRVSNTVTHYVTVFRYYLAMDGAAKDYSRYYLDLEPADPRNVSLVLVNSHYVIDGVMPLPPNVIEVGGLHLGKNKKPKPLPVDIEDWINNSDAGVIYFSLGSMIKSDTFPEEQLRAFIRAFAKLPQRVLWKWENDTMPDKPDNVMIRKWMPQFDILCHSNVKLFISHGGSLGTMEAVHCGVPIVAMPQFGDQLYNSYAIQNSGAGLVLHLQSATEEVITETLEKALSVELRHEAKLVSKKFKDRPLHPLDAAIFWIEHVAKFKGAEHMRSPGIDLPFYQYYLLDILAFIALVAVVFIFVIYKVAKGVLCRPNQAVKYKPL